MKFKLINEDIFLGDKTKFFTNGSKTIKLKPGDEIPDGFYLGRTFKTNPWNKGLTKETDERVVKNAEHTSQGLKGNIPWNKGLTKETNKSLQTVSSKVSQARKGKSSWNAGLTKETDERVKKSGEKQSKTKKENPPNSWSKGLTKETDDRIKKISDKMKGHKSFITDWETQKKKEYITKKKNNTFNSSKPEQELIKELQLEFGESNVIAPYRDERYPFNCDAYIKSEDLFIEYQGTWYHGTHPFDPFNEKDLELLNTWKLKSKTNSTYAYAIKVWTEIDPKKLNIFRKNNLNFKLIYPKENLIISK